MMKICLDTSPLSCHNDNDCPVPSVSPAYIAWPLTGDEIARVQTLTLEHATPLYVQQCGEERWLVCNPTGLGHIAVFDTQAMSLFSLFDTPVTISQAAQMIADWPRESTEQLAL